jgi:hypothetical protein
MKTVTEKAVKAMIEKSEKSKDANDALKFSQAALNMAHALATFNHAEKG